MGVEIEVLTGPAQFKAGGVGIGQVIMDARHQRAGGVLIIEAAAIIKGDVAAGFKAGAGQDQTGIGVVEEQIIAHHGIGTGVIEVNAKLLAAIDVIGLVAQNGRVRTMNVDAVVLIAIFARAHVAIENIVSDDRIGGRSIDNVQPGIGVLEDR